MDCRNCKTAEHMSGIVASTPGVSGSGGCTCGWRFGGASAGAGGTARFPFTVGSGGGGVMAGGFAAMSAGYAHPGSIDAALAMNEVVFVNGTALVIVPDPQMSPSVLRVVERDSMRAADAWSEAGEAMVVLGEPETAVEYLRTALELDPTNDRATDRLLDIVSPDDPALAVEIIEHELAELAQLHDPARKRPGSDHRRKPEVVQRRAAQHRRAAELWQTELGRVDRALWHFQQAWKLEPHRNEALDAARQLYASLGDDAMVAKLWKAELDVIGSDRSAAAAERKATIRLELARLAIRGKDDAAAGHLEEAARLDPASLEVAEALAEVYATPGFRNDADDGAWRHKASELFVEVGRRRMASQGDSTGINYLRRAIGIDPYSKGSSVALEQALSETSQTREPKGGLSSVDHQIPVPTPQPVLYDGLTAQQCLERYEWIQRADEPSHAVRVVTIKRAEGRYLTAPQLAAARELWSAQLRTRVQSTTQAKPTLTVMVQVDCDE
jgi:tetratricopeptide (TPR) repeat protein